MYSLFVYKMFELYDKKKYLEIIADDYAMI